MEAECFLGGGDDRYALLKWNPRQLGEVAIGRLGIDNNGDAFGGKSKDGQSGLAMNPEDSSVQEDCEFIGCVVLRVFRHELLRVLEFRD